MDIRAWIELSWLAWIILWVAWGFTSKPTKRRQARGPEFLRRLPVLLGFWILFWPALHIGSLSWLILQPSLAANVTAVAMTIAGLGITVWARLYLGRNWSSNVTVKHDHELIQSGPYRFVRHPIYSGATLAALGLAVASGDLRSLVAIGLMLAGWRLKAAKEETFMTEEFGDTYRQYMKHVKALIPFVW